MEQEETIHAEVRLNFFFFTLDDSSVHYKLSLWIIMSVTHGGGCVVLAGAGGGRHRLAAHY